jgi:hypothetical protein
MEELLKQQNPNELIIKWKNIGFLTNVKNKRNVALAFELTLWYLSTDINYCTNSYISTLTHPVIYRIFRNIENDLPTEVIFNKVIEIIKSFKVKLDEIQTTDEWVNRDKNKTKDVEIEFISDFCDNFPFEFDVVPG